MYEIVKTVHVITVYISICLFVYRCALVYAARRPVKGKLLKIVPHINDALLLVMAITLAVMGQYSPLQQPWLAAKVILLIVYILLGMAALKWWVGTVKGGMAMLLALIAFGYMICLATNKQLVCNLVF